MFCACPELHTVIIEGAEKIEEAAFQYCKKLKNIYLPDTLVEIEKCSFEDTGIEFLIIPQSVLSIGEDNFPQNSNIAVLSDSTAINLDYYRDVYSTVTLYCNQSNTAAREVAKEYGFKRKSLSAFAKESSDYYQNCREFCEIESTDHVTPHKIYCETNYCKTKCEFYTACQANKETCIKEIFDEMLCQLSTREERIIRLLFGIDELKENSDIIILQALNMIPLQDGDEFADDSEDDGSWHISKFEHLRSIKAKALRKLRHPARSRALRSNDAGLVLLSTNETNYFNLWCAIFGVRADCRQIELEYYAEKKKAEEQRIKDEEEFAKRKIEQQLRITTDMTIENCCFGKFGQYVPHADLAIGEVIKLTGQEFIAQFGRTIFEEVVLALANNNLYFVDCDEGAKVNIQAYIESICPKTLSITIGGLDLSVRTFNCLKRAGIETVGDLTERSVEDMMRVRNLGKNSLEEIIHKLESLGVSLRVDRE